VHAATLEQASITATPIFGFFINDLAPALEMPNGMGSAGTGFMEFECCCVCYDMRKCSRAIFCCEGSATRDDATTGSKSM
jgi:hypothetical protein